MPWSKPLAPPARPVDNSVKMVEKSCSNGTSADPEKPFFQLAVFAKEPRPGRVKTRLSPPLSEEQAAVLAECWLTATLTALAGFAPILCHDGDGDYFRRTCPGHRLHPQGEGDLGTRLDRVFAALLPHGPTAIIGSDTPDLPVELVATAGAALVENDVVTIPARDGGYVLIALRAPQPQLFAAMPWSSPALLAETRRRAAALGLGYREIGLWEDVDDEGSLRRLLARQPEAPWSQQVRAWLAQAED